MSSELADASVDDAPIVDGPREAPTGAAPRSRRTGPSLSDPAAAFLASSVVWLSLLAALARTLDYVPGDTELTLLETKDLAWFAIAVAAFVLAVLTAVIYIADRRRRRNRFPRGYRAPQRGWPTVLEALGWLGVTAYTVAVVASAIWLSMFIVERVSTQLAPPSAGEIAMLLVLVGLYIYALIVVPAAGFTLPLMRRHRRQYPDDRDREGAGFQRTTRGLLMANAVIIVLVVVIEGLDVVGLLPR